LNPPIANIGYKGILKTSAELPKWFKTSKNAVSDAQTIAILMEKAGTGGALFRNLYRDFLKESDDLLKLDALKSGYEIFKDIAELWTNIAHLLNTFSQTGDSKWMEEVSAILKNLSDKEKKAVTLLATL
jgi:Domain of unknown function (DUF4872)